MCTNARMGSLADLLLINPSWTYRLQRDRAPVVEQMMNGGHRYAHLRSARLPPHIASLSIPAYLFVCRPRTHHLCARPDEAHDGIVGEAMCLAACVSLESSPFPSAF